MSNQPEFLSPSMTPSPAPIPENLVSPTPDPNVLQPAAESVPQQRIPHWLVRTELYLAARCLFPDLPRSWLTHFDAG